MIQLSAIDIILLSVLGCCFLIQIIFYLFVLSKPFSYAKKLSSHKIKFPPGRPSVSVIVTIKNDFYRLEDFLPSLLEQDYPQFEIIVVNDGVDDENESALIRLQNRYANLYSTKIPDNTRSLSRKKLALSLGIKAAKYDYLLFTEADSCPKSSNWIKLMARHFHGKESIVLGLSVKEREKGFLNNFISYDYLFSNLKVLSFALWDRPYAGDGRNFGYMKSYFDKEKGFSKYHYLPCGDDDLFINTISDKDNIAVEISPDSIIETKISGFKDFQRRKIDRTISAYFFKRGPVAFWRLESFTRVAFYLLLLPCFIGKDFVDVLPIAALSMFLLRLLIQLIVWIKTSMNLKIGRPSIFSPLYDFIQPLVNVYFFLYRVFRMKSNYVTKL